MKPSYEALASALQLCGEQFRDYQTQHEAKVPALKARKRVSMEEDHAEIDDLIRSTQSKASVNKSMAEMCEQLVKGTGVEFR